MSWGARRWLIPPCPLSPLLKAQWFSHWCQPHGHPCPQPHWPWSLCTQEGGSGTRVAPKSAGSGSCLLWLWDALVLGHPGCPPQTLCAAALESPPIPRRWWLVQWHCGGPNLHPAPCGGFIAGMNTVICQGRAAQLRWGLEGVLGTWNEAQELMAAYLLLPPLSQLFLAPHVTGQGVPREHHLPACSGQRHLVPLPSGSTLSTKPSSTLKAVPHPVVPLWPSACSFLGWGDVHVEPGAGLRLEKQREAREARPLSLNQRQL